MFLNRTEVTLALSPLVYARACLRGCYSVVRTLQVVDCRRSLARSSHTKTVRLLHNAVVCSSHSLADHRRRLPPPSWAGFWLWERWGRPYFVISCCRPKLTLQRCLGGTWSLIELLGLHAWTTTIGSLPLSWIRHNLLKNSVVYGKVRLCLSFWAKKFLSLAYRKVSNAYGNPRERWRSWALTMGFPWKILITPWIERRPWMENRGFYLIII